MGAHARLDMNMLAWVGGWWAMATPVNTNPKALTDCKWDDDVAIASGPLVSGLAASSASPIAFICF